MTEQTTIDLSSLGHSVADWSVSSGGGGGGSSSVGLSVVAQQEDPARPS
jgi:hypothetical protein